MYFSHPYSLYLFIYKTWNKTTSLCIYIYLIPTQRYSVQMTFGLSCCVQRHKLHVFLNTHTSSQCNQCPDQSSQAQNSSSVSGSYGLVLKSYHNDKIRKKLKTIVKQRTRNEIWAQQNRKGCESAPAFICKRAENNRSGLMHVKLYWQHLYHTNFI